MATQIKMCKLICKRCTTFSTVWNFTNWECYPKKVSFPLSSGDVAIYRLVMQYLGIGNTKKCYHCQPVQLYIPYIKFMKSISGYIVTFVCRSEFFGLSSCCCVGYRHKLVLFWIILVRRIRCPRLRAVRKIQINATLKRIFISKIWSFKEITKPSTQYPPAYNLLN